MNAQFDPLTGDPLPQGTAQNPVKVAVVEGNAPDLSALTDEELRQIEGLEKITRPELRMLLQKVLRAGWGYGKLTGKDLLEMALKTKDEAYEALKLTALTLAVNAGDWREFNALATFWAEREKGKPIQSLNAVVTVGVVEIVEEIAKRRKLQVIDVTPNN